LNKLPTSKSAASSFRGRGYQGYDEPTMTGDESRKLKVGNRVRWGADEGDQATVTETNWSGVSLKWDNRGEQSVLHNDMKLAVLVSKK
jgi:hypothetical protein